MRRRQWGSIAKRDELRRNRERDRRRRRITEKAKIETVLQALRSNSVGDFLSSISRATGSSSSQQILRLARAILLPPRQNISLTRSTR